MDKSTIINILSFVPVLAILYYYYVYKKKHDSDDLSDETTRNDDGDVFLNKLEGLGYFQFTAVIDLDELKSEIRDNYEKYGELSTIQTDEVPNCSRLYDTDAEYLFEEGGFIETLKIVQSAFNVRGLKLEINEHFESYSDGGADQWVIVNDRKYIIYEALTNRHGGWEIATKGLSYLLNKELGIQGSEEQVYHISGGNDANIIFLTPAMFEYLESTRLNEEFRPVKAGDKNENSIVGLTVRSYKNRCVKL